MDDSNVTRRKRVLFRSHHTGMKENDLLLGAFADAHLSALTDEEVAWFEWLLTSHDDIELNAWITGRQDYPREVEHPVMHRLLSFQLKP